MKKGDWLSVLDDDLKGKVVTLKGDKIEIEDEFGFRHWFAQGQLVVQNSSLYDEVSVVKKQESTKKLSKSHQKKEMKLDLHFDQLVKYPEKYDSWERIQIQREKLIETLDYCKANFIPKLLIIHGLGDGVLQEMVYETLRGTSQIEFEENEFFKHSSASVEVSFIR